MVRIHRGSIIIAYNKTLLFGIIAQNEFHLILSIILKCCTSRHFIIQKPHVLDGCVIPCRSPIIQSPETIAHITVANSGSIFHISGITSEIRY